MENANSKPQDCYLKGVKVPESAPSNTSWLKSASDKRADAVRPMGDAFPESEKPTADARK
jgi:hypothetical protein